MLTVIKMMMRHMVWNLGGHYSRIDFTSTIRYLSSMPPHNRLDRANIYKRRNQICLILQILSRTIFSLKPDLIPIPRFRLWQSSTEFSHNNIYVYQHCGIHQTKHCSPSLHPYFHTFVSSAGTKEQLCIAECVSSLLLKYIVWTVLKLEL